ncbi:MAG: acetyl-CoA hydrolase/transferase C-terminal domain-containing protein [Usitatibacteraceae bacterium]
MTTTKIIDSIEAAVDHILHLIPGDIVFGIPLGIGKPNPFVNALYARIKADPSRRLRIITALSLEKPLGKSELERHFLEPLVERVFGNYPDLLYVKDSRAGTLPANIEVCEFFMKTGDYLNNEAAQQNYISTNYTFVARDMAVQGMNVIAQAVAAKGEGESLSLSLSSNTDVTFEIVENARAADKPLMVVGVINRDMPFMPNSAEVPPNFFDIVVTDPAATHTLFSPPNGKVSTADYAIGLHASSLVDDGGTLQIGIGALGDAIAQALIVRDRHGDEYRRILDSICADGLAGRELGRFDEGLYGCSEMFVNGFLKLIEAGIVRREVYADATLQRLINEGLIDDSIVTPDTLRALLRSGRIHANLRARDLAFLQKYGIIRAEVGIDKDTLVLQGTRVMNDLSEPGAFDRISAEMLGARLKNGIFMTGGFFLGPQDFYQRLRTMPPQELAKIDMTRIDFINQLYGDDELKRAQRRKARFMNTAMMMTMLGAAVSDGLESGQVVSGVGGQYNFVAMSHALPDARLLMMLRSTHEHKDGLRSSIVWSYGHTTIPRHLRDVVITEYGVADLRGQPDSEVIKRLLAVADSRFQSQLLNEAKVHRKIGADYEIPDRYRANLPQTLDDKLHPWSEAGLLPDFPFGTDLTLDELHIVRALKRLKRATEHPTELVTLAVKSLWEGKEAPRAYLERLGLADAKSFRDMFVRKLFAGNL